MTARVGPRLSAALADLGVAHPGDPHPVAREDPVPRAPATDPTAILRVVVRLAPEAGATSNHELLAAGLFHATGSGTIRTGAVSLEAVPPLAAHPAVASIELRETLDQDIHTSVPATHADVVRTGSFGLTGAGVIVGVIDSGIDIFHHAFRHDDGSTRILALHDFTSPHRLTATGTPTGGNVTLGWFPPKGKPGAGTMQSVTVPFNASAAQVRTAWEAIAAIQSGDIEVTGGPLPGTPITMRFTGRYRHKDVDSIDVTASTITPAGTALTVEHGARYSEEDIQDALDADDRDYGSWDADGHGTHCAGIAAGDGSQAGNCHLADYYVGVAPEADLVIAKADSDDTMIEALDFIFTEADAQSMPAVINISQGGRSGARDGSTDLELKIDELLQGAPEGRVIIKSAGNNGRLHDYTQATPQVFTPGSSLHGRGTATTATPLELTALVIARDRVADFFDFWYAGTGRLGITVKAPRDPATTTEVLPGAAASTQTLHRHSIRVTSEIAASVTDRHRITVRITPPPGGQIRQGEWVFTLRLDSGPDTEVDCWIQLEKSDAHARFVASDHERARTLTPPGTAHRIITVANYDHRDNEIAESSSRGPTTDSRTGLETKPDIAAPGTGITAAKSGATNDGICCDCCSDFYTTKSGTSMAAPHITGVVALMLEFDDELTWEDVRNHLRSSAQPPDPITGPTLPDHTWGAGVVHAEMAIQAIEDSVHVGDGPSARGTSRRAVAQSTTTARRAPAVVPALAAQIRPGAPGAAAFDELRAAVLATPVGQLLFALVSTHLSEALRLVNTERRVTVAWHRMGGPALIDAVLASPGGAPVRVPELVAGRELRPGLERFLDALTEAGSLPLRQDVARHRELLASLPGVELAELARLEVAG